jgi:hypothetical protein
VVVGEHDARGVEGAEAFDPGRGLGELSGAAVAVGAAGQDVAGEVARRVVRLPRDHHHPVAAADDE